MTSTLRLLAPLALLAASAVAQTEAPDRFEGWSRMRDPGYRFDPDQRRIQGFSVRATTSARSALEDVDAAWEAGDVEAAARILLRLATGAGGEVVPIATTPDGERWMGAAEWALYQLRTRVPAEVVEDLVLAEDREAVELATAWRDLDRLQSLAWRLEAAESGRDAAAALARLELERGAWEGAGAAARRASSLGAGASMTELAERLPTTPDERDGPGAFPPDLERDWARSLTVSVLGDPFHKVDNPFTIYIGGDEARYAPVQPVVSENVVYVSDSISVSAMDLVSGRTLWHHAGPLERVTLDGTEHRWFDFPVYARSRRQRAISPYQCARPVLTGHRVLATVQATEPWHELDEFEGYPINHPLPWRRLRAFHRDTGEVLWTQERDDLPERAFVNRFDVAGPPAVGGGVAYVSGSVTEGAINAYLAAFDVETGDLVWRTLLCSGQAELTMFNRPFQEHVVSPPLLHEGSLYVSTNLGVVGCVDAWSGRVRWLASYESIPREGARTVRPDRVARPVFWLNQEPFVEGGTLMVAPLDSRYLLALDPATGRLSWRLDAYNLYRRSPIRHQALPRGDGDVLVVTDSGFECYEARTGRVVFPHRLLETSPFVDSRDGVTGAVTRSGDTLLVPCAGQLVLADVADGSVTGVMEWESTAFGRKVQRVVHAGDAFVMNDGSDVFAAQDVDALLAAADEASTAEQRLVLAEQALADHRYDEAQDRFTELLGTPRDALGGLRREALEARASSGRLEATVRRARFRDSAEDWTRVLEVATSTDQLFTWAPEALAAIEAGGDLADVSRWLGELARRAPGRQLDFGPDGPQDVALLDIRYRLPFESPAEQLRLLHELLHSVADARWGGLPAHEEARRRIDALVDAHGRELYAPFEAAARADLERGMPLEVVEVRYPNAAVVAEERALELDRLLELGRAREAFEAAAYLTGGPERLALRERAARALGETRYADLLSGAEPLPVGMPPLPRLPAKGDGTFRIPIHDRNDVVFRQVAGHPDPEYAGCALGIVDGEGQFFLLDTRTGEPRWSGRSLPGRNTRIRNGVDVHLEGDLYVLRADQTVQVGRLEDGHALWSTTIPAFFQMTTAGGLVFTLRELTDDVLRVDAFGLRTGAHAYSIDLPEAQGASDLRMVGPYLMVSTRSYGLDGRNRTHRLVVLDVARGEVASSTAVDADLVVVNVLPEPPTVFLSARRSSSESRLVAWSPASASVLWEASVPDGQITRRELFPTAPGRMAFCESTQLEDTVGHADIVHPVDALAGPLDPPAGVPLYTVVDGRGGAPAPTVVMRDPLTKQRVAVLDGATLDVRYELEFDTPLMGFTQAFQGEDGYVIVSETSYQPSFVTSVWIVRGEDGRESYSVQLDEPSQRDSADVLLVDGAVLLAIRGTVHVIRDGTQK